MANRLAVALLAVHAALMCYGAGRNGFTRTEVPHLAAGIAHWRSGTFEHYRVNPPLVRSIAALPVLLLMDPQLPTTKAHENPRVRSEQTLARLMIEANGSRAVSMIWVARWTCIPISLLGAWICYRWAAQLYGPRAGLLAMALWSFSPEMIAHGQLITGDAAAAAFGLTTFYLLRQWLCCRKWTLAVALGAAMGLAVLSKTSWLIAFALVPMLWLTTRARFPTCENRLTLWARFLSCQDRTHRAPVTTLWIEAAMIGLSILVALLLINAVYGFSGSFRPLDEYNFLSRALRGDGPEPQWPPVLDASNRFRGTSWGSLPVPLPKDFVLGVDLQKWDLERPRFSYMDGQWRRGGWWDYYLYALMCKWPLGNWMLLALAIVAVLISGVGRRRGGEELLLIVPAIAILLLVSSQTGLSRHSRYVLPMLPFLLVWMGRAATIELPAPARRVLVGLLLAWSVTSSLWIYPHSMSYFNESVGGPLNGYRYLNSSNIHYGQDLTFLKRWYDAHPEARPLYVNNHSRLALVGFGAGQPLGTAQANAEDPLQDVWIAVDIAQLTESPTPVRTKMVEDLPLAAMAGYGYRIYRLPSAEAAQVRCQLRMGFRKF